MSSILYRHKIGGKGIAQGLPVRRASQLYDVEPTLRYPTAFSTGLDSDQHTYDKGIYLRLPHLPVTFVVEPYINNPKAGGNFTRRQYFVIKRGQAVMASQKREPSIGVINADGDAFDGVTYADPNEFEMLGNLTGYKLTGDEDLVTDHDDGDEIDVQVWDALTQEEQAEFTPIYERAEDTNDRIPTGGVDQFANIETQLFGSSDRTEYVDVDADAFYFGSASRSQGFIYPSTGGADRIALFTEVDTEAGVTLPPSGEDEARIVQPYAYDGNLSDEAVVLPARPTIGFAHTDWEQATSHQYHQFTTGTEPCQPVRKCTLKIPFVDLAKLHEVIAEKAGLTPGEDFNFTDQSEFASGVDRTGLKVGIFDEPTFAETLTYSTLTGADAGYANLYFNFAAPFVVAPNALSMHDEIVPDLFGNYTVVGATYTDAAGEEAVAKEVQARHRAGRVINIYDVPRRAINNLAQNPVWQTRLTNAPRNYTNEGYRRAKGADTAGVEQILADFAFMLLGGSSKEFKKLLPKYNGMGRDISQVLEDLILEGALGVVEIAGDVINR